MAIVGGAGLSTQRSNIGGIGFGSVPIAPSASYGDPSLFGKSVTQQGGDYDNIMGNYRSELGRPATSGISYNSSPDVTNAMSNLSDLAISGGYTPQGISDLRARGVSPIRSIYSSAQQGLARQRALQGGYSPGFATANARMAREMSNLISDKTIDVNAGIAENVARNRLAAAPQYANLASSEAGRNLDVSQFNKNLELSDRAARMEAINGMRGIYGTTPALTDMFGRQVASAAQLGQNQQQINNQRDAQVGALAGRILF